MPKSITYRITKGSNKFYNSWISFASFLGAMGIIGIIQIVLFSIGYEVNGTTINSSDSWTGWIYLVICIPASMLSFTGWIYSIRVDKKFFIPTLLGQTISVFIYFIGGLVWTSLMIFAGIIIGFVRFQLISKQGSNYKINDSNLIVFGTMVVILFLFLGIVFINVESLSIIWWRGIASENSNVGLATRYLDVITATITLTALLLLLGKSKYSFMVFILCNFFFIILTSLTGQWLSLFQISIYLISNIFALMSWSYIDKHPEQFSENKNI